MRNHSYSLVFLVSGVVGCGTTELGTPTVDSRVTAVSVLPRGLITDGEGVATTVVTVTREAGTDGAVEVRVEALPDGASADPLVIGAGETEGVLTIRSELAARALTPIRVVAGDAAPASAAAVLATGGIDNGVLDPSFGAGGVSAEYVVPHWGQQTDGTILAIAGSRLIRLRADGTPDGFATEALPLERVHAAKSTAGGGLIAVGSTRTIVDEFLRIRGTVWTLRSDGTIESEQTLTDLRDVFGFTVLPGGTLRVMGQSQGYSLTSVTIGDGSEGDYTFFGQMLWITHAIALADGGWLVAGSERERGMLIKLDSRGAPDTRFGDAGVRAPVDARYLGVRALPDGGFIALRTDSFAGIDADAFVERFDATGEVQSVWQFASDDLAAQGWAFDGAGRPVIALGGAARSSVLRLDAGELDDSFGDAGVMDVSAYTGEAAPFSGVATDGAGRIVVSDTNGLTMRIIP